MKNIWKIFEFEKYDVLVTKAFENDKYSLRFTICPEIGDEVYIGVGIDNIENLNRAFEIQDEKSVLGFLEYLLKSLNGQGIFEGDNDKLEIEIQMEGPSLILAR
jgi:hypothetical protein